MKSSTDVEHLLQELDKCRAFVTKLIKDVRSAHDDDGMDVLMLARHLEAAEPEWAWSDLASMIATARSSVDRDASAAILQLETDLRDLCTRRSWRVDGQWPRLYVERAIQVEVDEKGHAVSIRGARLRRSGLKDIERILEKEIKELIPRSFDPLKFIAQLSKAYDSASSGKGGETPLLRVYREMIVLAQSSSLWRDARARAFTELNADQFRARLSAALESGACVAPDGRELRLLPPIDPKEAMFVYQPAERRFGFIGRIQFRASEEGNA